MPDTCHMHTYLMCTSRFKFKLHIRIISKAFKHFVMRNSWFSVFLVNSHFFTLDGMPTNRTFNGSFIIFYISTHNSYINSIDRMFLDLLRNIYMCLIIFTHNQRSCSVHINTMHNSRTDFAVNSTQGIFTMIHNCIY